MFSFDVEYEPMDNIQALRAIINAIEHNPNDIHILINLSCDSDVFDHKNTKEDVIIDVTLAGTDDNTYTFQLDSEIQCTAASQVNLMIHEQYLIGVKSALNARTLSNINMKTIDAYGRIHEEKDVSLKPSDIQPEIRKIFDIINRKAQSNSYAVVTYDLDFNPVPF